MHQPEANKTQDEAQADAPFVPKPRDPRALSAYRHGLTGQIHILTAADQAAYGKHCQGYHKSLAPIGPVETDLVQSAAEDRWRLKRAAALEAAIFAYGLSQPDEITSGNSEVDTALAQGRIWLAKGGNLQLLGLYESRMQRRFEKNMAELRTLQAERKVAIEQALEEAELLGQLAESKGEDPTAYHTSLLARFDFSTNDVARLLHRMRSLRQARKQFPEPQKPRLVA